MKYLRLVAYASKEWVTCTPKDTLIEVGRCAASKNLKNSVDCTLSYETGTIDTESQSSGSSTTSSVSASVGVTLENLFSASTSLSQEWKTWQSTTTSHTFTKSQTFTIAITAEPGETVVIGQRIAACGKYKVSSSYEVFSEKLGNQLNRARRLISKVQIL
uniref:Uncharacterized protein n=1 Tax=Panagrolaimus superbus TaxID=310955 RepID=A0A914YVS7_9BILA